MTDSVILSRRARAVLDEMRSRPDLDLSIQSKMHAEHLTDQRTFEVIGRLERGFYANANVLYRVASHVGRALTYEP